MARITVEDCLEKVGNRFDLVMVASKRARELALKGAESNLEWENDKATVLALREVAHGLVDKSILTEKPKTQLLDEQESDNDSNEGDSQNGAA